MFGTGYYLPPQTMPTTSVQPTGLCLVCSSRKPCPSVRSKQPTVCEACKKFFLRHRDIRIQQALQCATGRRDCDVTVTTKRPCSSCRLTKCFSIGMRFEDYPMRTKAKKRLLSSTDATQERSPEPQTKRSSSPSVTSDEQSSGESPELGSSSNEPTPNTDEEERQEYDAVFDLTGHQQQVDGDQPSSSNNNAMFAITRFAPIPNAPRLHTFAEDFLKKSLRALTELTAFETLPLRRSVGQFPPDENTWWHLKMEHFQAAARSATAYVRQLPAFTTIPLVDRPLLFANALYPLLIADLALPSQPRGLSFLGMNEQNRAMFLQYFSEFQLLSEDTNRITEVFAVWRPTMFEFAILAALLFYEPCFPGLQSVEIVRQVNDQLRMVLRAFLPQQCSNPKLVSWRLQQFEIAFEMLRRASVDHCLAIEMLARRRPGFVSMNDLFFEVFTHTQRAVNIMGQRQQVAPMNNGLVSNHHPLEEQQQLQSGYQQPPSNHLPSSELELAPRSGYNIEPSYFEHSASLSEPILLPDSACHFAQSDYSLQQQNPYTTLF